MKSQSGLICILLMSKDVWDFMKLKENSYCKRNMNELKGLNRKKFSAHLTEVSRIDEELRKPGKLTTHRENQDLICSTHMMAHSHL